MTQPMTQFWFIHAGKSDGHDIVSQKGRPLRNGPTEAQLDRKPNDQGQCDYYRLIEKDDPKHVDWRKKLGGMLVREIGGKEYEDKWQQTILYDFPENYKLYEHIKTKADGQAKTVKNHSGGGHDRQDAYLYGYPKGPRKRYRSPADFFPHLLWLCTDENSDYQNCTCKMCSPVQLEVEKPAAKPEVKSEPTVTVKSVAPTNAPVVAPARRSVSGPPSQSPSLTQATPATAPSQTANTPQIRAPALPQSSPLPQPRTAEQLTDSRYGSFMCRTGELVWFLRLKTNGAWGLGLVIQRWMAKDNSGAKTYLVQPLSHPYDSTTPEAVTSDEHVKPWLAWSAPACTYSYLQQNSQLSYDQVDWGQLLSGRFGQGVADVDASILASKAIDTTYTLLDRVKTASNATGEARHYNCIYLGAEKIWRGDPVRIHTESVNDLMVVTDILEYATTISAQGQPGAQAPSQVCLVGDIYSYSTMSAPNPSQLPTPPSSSNNNIPLRMREDIAWRNRTLVPTTQTLAWWRLVAPSSRVEIADIKGRWYETSLLFKESFHKAVKNNQGGNGIWMNARGDSTAVGRVTGTPRTDRVSAFGHALPKGTQIVEGLEPPAPTLTQGGQVPTSDMQGLDIGLGANGGDAFSLDDFMNVDHLDDGAGGGFNTNFQF